MVERLYVLLVLVREYYMVVIVVAVAARRRAQTAWRASTLITNKHSPNEEK